ncbi:hypothetical protein GY45DRAFT_1318034 [Cubamyces sp. BRFM 1775]|nr:hypothetical protein GY45DRAFT_1318034 [Cubamyces sp. BRFM 1775]
MSIAICGLNLCQPTSARDEWCNACSSAMSMADQGTLAMSDNLSLRRINKSEFEWARRRPACHAVNVSLSECRNHWLTSI